ncbi:cytochrome c oxidase assembly protein [Devosia sediminis]|uniref:Cytochrome c oxidase assembly protein CtaG n=1 Tax=Devosia sediminis TaxID=2798801 RepID=A0A934IYT3_9HYPH|nr:cytochrome c oxidase assembly protein [Devosia sediminis]MBJ3784707.1 cytochrome c oxidase assembly protein [Devosia sediminis]
MILDRSVQPASTTSLHHRNRRTFRLLLCGATGMLGLAFLAVPLYGLFCSVTGYGGTPGQSEGNVKGVVDRPITVSFDANIDRGLPWAIRRADPVTSRIGSVEVVNYRATNLSDQPVTGMAVFNVTPDRAGYYFNKVECFCFTEQTLQPGETLDMPIQFFVDPDFAGNPELDTIGEITLSYTFYRK